jgi:hypothetical protein
MSIELAEENERQAPVERPTVGRRLYYWSHLHNGVLDPAQAFDAGVLFVHADGRANLLVTTHSGAQRIERNVEVRNPGEDRQGHEAAEGYATWMPFQRKQQQAAPERVVFTAPAIPGVGQTFAGSSGA